MPFVFLRLCCQRVGTLQFVSRPYLLLSVGQTIFQLRNAALEEVQGLGQVGASGMIRLLPVSSGCLVSFDIFLPGIAVVVVVVN